MIANNTQLGKHQSHPDYTHPDYTHPESQSIFDVAVIGAGPVGLFAVFELGLLGLRACVIDVLPRAGGQCIELYPEKPIYDIPGVPECTGAMLTENLLKQCQPFSPTFFFRHHVTGITPTMLPLPVTNSLHKKATGHHDKTQTNVKQEQQEISETTCKGWSIHATTDPDNPNTNQMTTLTARTVAFSTGAGRFVSKRLGIANEERFAGSSLFYAVRDKSLLKNKRVVIVGGGDSAVDWALALKDTAQSITVIHRRTQFRAAPAMVEKLWERVSEPNTSLSLITGVVRALHGHEDSGVLTSVTMEGNIAHSESSIQAQTKNPSTLEIDCDVMLVFYGLSIKVGSAITGSGLEHDDRGLIPVDTHQFSTNLDGVYAIGDANTYPGKLKLILCGFHEGALMARAAYHHIYQKNARFEYTTTSSNLKRKLTSQIAS